VTTTYLVHDRGNGTVVQSFGEKWLAEEKLRQMQGIALSCGWPVGRFEIERVLDARSRRMRRRTKAAWILVERHRSEYEAIRDELEAAEEKTA